MHNPDIYSISLPLVLLSLTKSFDINQSPTQTCTKTMARRAKPNSCLDLDILCLYHEIQLQRCVYNHTGLTVKSIARAL